MKTTAMLLLGGALVGAGLTISKRMSTEDKQKLKDMLSAKLKGSLPLALQSKLSASN